MRKSASQETSKDLLTDKETGYFFLPNIFEPNEENSQWLVIVLAPVKYNLAEL